MKNLVSFRIIENFPRKIKQKIIELIPKSEINLIINDCTIRGKLSIIQFDKYKLPVVCTAEAGEFL